MKTFKYTAINLSREEFSGTFIAKDEQDLAQQLSKQNLFLVSCSVYSGNTPSSFFTLGTGKVSNSELTLFCRQFSIMINTGIPMLDCLDCLKDQNFSSYFHKLILVIYEDVKSGKMLSDAIKKHKKVFPEFFTSMIYVGEASGKLDIVFNSLADYYEKDAAIRRKRNSALAYPIMLGVLTIGIVVLMLLFVIPRFKDVLSKLEVEITGFTKAVYDISDFLLKYWLYVLAGIIVVVLIFLGIKLTKKGAYMYDKLSLHMPFFGKVNVYQVTARFARSFGLLLTSGMDMSEAMDAVQVVLVNRDVKARFAKAAEDVRHGMQLSLALKKYKIFPQILIQMIAIGERTASIDSILLRSCSFFEDQVESALLSATSKLQPIMLIILAAIVLVLFLAAYSPMISIMNGLGVH